MKKKTLALTGLVVAAGLSLASCGPKESVVEGSATNKDGYTYEAAPTFTPYSDSLGEVKVYLNYQAKSGVTYRQETAYTNPFDGQTYQQNDILPTWKEFAKNCNITIKDVASYTDKSDNDTYKTVSGKSFLASEGGMDLFMNTVANITKMGVEGNAYDLTEYIEKGNMPNFKAYLDENPDVKNQITTKDGKIFYTPYFDGYNDIERMFQMDTSMVDIVLNATNFDDFDTSINGDKKADSKVVSGGYYQPFINAEFNYDKDTQVQVSVNSKLQNITIKKTTNIIKQQNELLNRAGGCTGKELAQQFREYLENAFGSYVGSNKIYKTYAEIFTSEAAAYNADELIALMRVIKANPLKVTNNDKDTVVTFFPRGEAQNRVANILDFAQVWGISGLDSEANNFYFDANGKINALGSTTAAYDALELLNQVYNEGLILKDFWNVPSKANNAKYLNQYWKKTSNDYGYGFMMYDYCASTSGSSNDAVAGVGTKTEDRKTPEGYESTGIMPVLSPLTMWGTEKTWKATQSLSDTTGKTLIRFSESNRSLKSGSWCIPKTATNVAGAVRLMDFLFSDYGSLINTFGPTDYWYHPTTDTTETPLWATDIAGAEKAPVFGNKLTDELQAQNADYWTYMRNYVGSTQGIGSVRNGQADFQATNAYAQTGLKNVKNAIFSGALKLAKVQTTANFYKSVFIGNYGQAPTDSTSYDAVTKFWEDNKSSVVSGWAQYVVRPVGADYSNTVVATGTDETKYTFKQVKDKIAIYNTVYLYTLVSGQGNSYVPDYAKQ